MTRKFFTSIVLLLFSFFCSAQRSLNLTLQECGENLFNEVSEIYDTVIIVSQVEITSNSPNRPAEFLYCASKYLDRWQMIIVKRQQTGTEIIFKKSEWIEIPKENDIDWIISTHNIELNSELTNMRTVGHKYSQRKIDSSDVFYLAQVSTYREVIVSINGKRHDGVLELATLYRPELWEKLPYSMRLISFFNNFRCSIGW